MKSIPRLVRRTRPTDGITPPTTAASPHTPSWPGRRITDDYTPLNLPPENPHLLQAFPYPPAPEFGAPARPPCRILDASRTEHERQQRTAALAFEIAVAENTLILHPDDATAAEYLTVLTAALPVITDRVAPSAVTR